MAKTPHDREVRSSWQALSPKIEQLFAEQWGRPELPCLEYESSACLAAWLEESGFAVNRSAFGIPTAFLARRRIGEGGPRIAILAEYDALPGLDNGAEPERRALGLPAGHGCGHNHIGPANCGAAIAAADAAARLELDGEIAVVGCPAEEILWGKVALLRQGAFAGFDAVLTSHGDYQNGSLSRPCSSVVSGEFVFRGTSGHAGLASTANALDAAELAVQMMDKLRLTRFPGVPVRHVLRRGGMMPGITPDEARLWISARSLDFSQAREMYGEIARSMEVAAGTSGIGLRHQFISECRGYLPNDTLAGVLLDAMEEVGPPKWTDEHFEWMETLVGNCAPGAKMTLDTSIRCYDAGADYYGQDDGEVSWRIPLGRINWAYPREVPIHHWAWTALSGHAAGSPGPLMASETLALAAVRLLSAPSVLAAAKNELQRRTDGLTVDLPRLGAWETMTKRPQDFWNGSWDE